MEAGKRKVKSWDELRAELQRLAGEAACKELDHALANGRKISAIKLLRECGVEVYEE